MAPQASKKCGLLPPDYHRLAFCTNNGLDSGQVPGTFFALVPLWLTRMEPKGLAPPSAAVPVPLPTKRRRKVE
jgi:hypothetical protein